MSMALDLENVISRRCRAIPMWCWHMGRRASCWRVWGNLRKYLFKINTGKNACATLYRGGIASSAQVLSQDDGICQFFHRAAQTAAFIPKAQVRFFFRELITLLQNALGALHYLARFELAFHLHGLFNEPGIRFGQDRF